MANQVNERVSRTIRDQMKARGLSTSDLGNILGRNRSYPYMKLASKRLWSVADLNTLAGAGFDFSGLFSKEASNA